MEKIGCSHCVDQLEIVCPTLGSSTHSDRCLTSKEKENLAIFDLNSVKTILILGLNWEFMMWRRARGAYQTSVIILSDRNKSMHAIVQLFITTNGGFLSSFFFFSLSGVNLSTITAIYHGWHYNHDHFVVQSLSEANARNGSTVSALAPPLSWRNLLFALLFSVNVNLRHFRCH